MFQSVLHLCWLNLRFPSTATSIAPLIDADRRRRHRSRVETEVEAEREFWWDDRLVRFHLAYDRHCRGTDRPVPLEEAWRQFCDGSAYVRKGFVPGIVRLMHAVLDRPLAKPLRSGQDRKLDRELAGIPVVSIIGNVAVIVLILVLRAMACIVVTISQRLKDKIAVTNRRIHEKLSAKIDLAIL